jgi:hypothetical protein
MKYLHLLLLATHLGLFPLPSQAQVMTLENSPYNMDNSQYNVNSKNGVYDNTGNRIGYEVKAPSGVTNYFDNSGNRIGYTPSKR